MFSNEVSLYMALKCILCYGTGHLKKIAGLYICKLISASCMNLSLQLSVIAYRDKLKIL